MIGCGGGLCFLWWALFSGGVVGGWFGFLCLVLVVGECGGVGLVSALVEAFESAAGVVPGGVSGLWGLCGWGCGFVGW